MNRNGPERCKSCSAPAAVRMQGISLCARCGLERSSGGTSRVSRRMALLGILSSGFLAKMVLGAVAVAAVGGVVVSGNGNAGAPPATTATAQTLLQTQAPVLAADLVPSISADDALVERVYEYADAVQRWGDCVSAAAREHSGGPFDPKATCGATPDATEHGLTTLPGKSATAPGQQDDPPGKSATAPPAKSGE